MAKLLPRLIGAFFLLIVSTAQAQAPLLTPSDIAQLKTWLGGPFTLVRLYEKHDGQTAADFHAAVDGKGRTFTVMEATTELGQTFKVGGYNPQSWDSSDAFHITTEDASRTGFLFNLTSRQVHRQTPRTYALDTVGSFQTWNNPKTGPVFGAGHDLYVGWDLTTGGYSSMYSYIDPARSDFDSSLLDGRDYKAPNITYGEMEVWRVFAVPEAGTWMMLLSGLCLIGLMRFWSPACRLIQPGNPAHEPKNHCESGEHQSELPPHFLKQLGKALIHSHFKTRNGLGVHLGNFVNRFHFNLEFRNADFDFHDTPSAQFLLTVTQTWDRDIELGQAGSR